MATPPFCLCKLRDQKELQMHTFHTITVTGFFYLQIEQMDEESTMEEVDTFSVRVDLDDIRFWIPMSKTH